MAHSSHSKGSVSVDLFNLPTLPNERRVTTSYLDIPVNFYLPDRKNSKISKIVNRQSFDRQTPDGNEGFVIEIQYLKRAFGTKTYLIDKVTGSLFALHNEHIESTGFCGSECAFDLQELEFHICDLADQRNGEEDTGSIAEERRASQGPHHQTPDAPPSPGPPMIPDGFPMYEEWENLAHQGLSFSISYRQQIYEGHSEIITTLIDCFSELNKHTKSYPETELECHHEKTRHFSYYSWLIQHIDNVLQDDNIFRCNNDLHDLHDCRDFVMAYLDDIIIFSRTPEEHLKHIEIIFQKLKAPGLKLKESKCDFFKSEIHYLGHLISDKGIQPLPEKLDTI